MGVRCHSEASRCVEGDPLRLLSVDCRPGLQRRDAPGHPRNPLSVTDRQLWEVQRGQVLPRPLSPVTVDLHWPPEKLKGKAVELDS